MNKRELVLSILDKKNTSGKNALWLGKPRQDTLEKYLLESHFNDADELLEFLDDDCRWRNANHCYFSKNNRPMFDALQGKERTSLAEEGCFADFEDGDEDKLNEFVWPSIDDLNFDSVIEYMDKHIDKGFFSGMWCAFFHHISDFFGMENYFCKMYTDKKMVHKVTEKVCEFYLDANEKFIAQAGDRFDTLFIGNDFGSQKDLLFSPELFNEFMLPYIKKFVDQGKKHGKRIMVHSCGSIVRIIPSLIDVGVDAIHPLQALACGMDAKRLTQEFKGKVAFVGGVDMQNLLQNGSEAQVRDEVLRLRELFGENYIVSPSHECILPNIPLKNIVAMCRASKE